MSFYIRNIAVFRVMSIQPGKPLQNGVTVIFGFDFANSGGSSGRSVRGGATDGLHSASDDVQM